MEKRTHWLYRKENLPKLWGVQLLLLVLVLVPEFFVHHHAPVAGRDAGMAGTWGFYAWYGFLACAAMVVAAKLLSFLLKRRDDYYRNDQDDD